VTVTLKLVQVYVTDKEGNPVPDLRLEDFRLFDNGKPVAITEFEKHSLLLPGTAPEEPAGPSPAGPSRLSRRFFLSLTPLQQSQAWKRPRKRLSISLTSRSRLPMRSEFFLFPV